MAFFRDDAASSQLRKECIHAEIILHGSYASRFARVAAIEQPVLESGDVMEVSIICVEHIFLCGIAFIMLPFAEGRATVV